ncbi:uncharacterized protein V1518DRAFT_425286 [Limtongia smithiae]|uniref:uncharacterized protein n=1 Tax=Limtongia smithiae TaxID=1125753 RepID=UPI0034CD3DEB
MNPRTTAETEIRDLPPGHRDCCFSRLAVFELPSQRSTRDLKLETEISPPSSPDLIRPLTASSSDLLRRIIHNIADDDSDDESSTEPARKRARLDNGRVDKDDENDAQDSRHAALSVVKINATPTPTPTPKQEDHDGDTFVDDKPGKKRRKKKKKGRVITNTDGSSASTPIELEDERLREEPSIPASPRSSFIAINDDNEGAESDCKEPERSFDVEEMPKGATRPPRFMKLGIVDGCITVLDNPFSDEEEPEPEVEEESDTEPGREKDRADLLVKPVSKKRKRELETAKEQEDRDEVDEQSYIQELVEVRGDGRYFGNGDGGREILCINCHKPGHMASECRVIVCSTCGEVGDHLTRNCPKTKRCSNCNKLGHTAASCVERRKDIYCSRCRSSRHGHETCPSIWCYYTFSGQPLKPIERMYCYNCGEEGHFGDDCPRPPPPLQPVLDGTAFSVSNLPEGYQFTPELNKVIRNQGGLLERQHSNLDSYRPSENSYRSDSYRDRDNDRGSRNTRDYDRRNDYRSNGRSDYRNDRSDYNKNNDRSYQGRDRLQNFISGAGYGASSRHSRPQRYGDSDRDDWTSRHGRNNRSVK